MAPDVPLYVAPDEKPYSILDPKRGTVCPHCGHAEVVNLGKGKNKKVKLSLLVHPDWLKGAPKVDEQGQPYGGSAQDDAESTARWNLKRASTIRLLEVRGELPEEVTCPETSVTFKTGKEGGTVPKKSNYACAACGTVQDVLETVKASGKTGPMAAYAIQGYAPQRAERKAPYGGRFFAPFDETFARQYNAALEEWEARKDGDLADYWPRSAIPYGFMTGIANGDIREGHGFTHWWTMFNPRQLLVHAQLLKAIATVGDYDWKVREYVLGAFQQYIRFNCQFTVYHPRNDQATKHFANNNFHPRSTILETPVFSPLWAMGDGTSQEMQSLDSALWAKSPWELSVPPDQRRSPIAIQSYR